MKKYKYEQIISFEGKRYHVRADSKRGLVEKVALKRRDLEEGRVTVSGSMTLAQWTKRCLDVYKSNISDSYREEMRMRINKHILSEIGHLPLKSIKPMMCQQILNSQSGMSKSHITKLHQEMTFIFQKAVENKLILESPAAHLIRPAGTEGKRRSITPNERKHLLRVADDDSRFILFLLMLYCGCRPSEAMEVQGRDLSQVEGMNVLHIRGTKTENSDRLVPLPDELYPIVAATEPFQYVSPNASGRKHSKASYRRLSESLKRAMNISMGARTYRNKLVPPFPLAEDFTPYMLRHTYCTDLQKMGVDVRMAQKLMGHADISTTANIYTHQDDETLLAAGKLMGVSTNKKIKKQV